MLPPVDRLEVFDNDDHLATLVGTLQPGETLWLRPRLWRQPGYDLLRFAFDVTGQRSMVASNAASAKKHDMKLEALRTTATVLGNAGFPIDSICFEFLVDGHLAADFTVGTVSGFLCEWRGVPGGVRWPKTSNVDALESAGCLRVAYVARLTASP